MEPLVMILVVLMQVTIRRDSMTTTSVEVAGYELPMLELIYGEGNVFKLSEDVQPRQIDDVGSEFERLAQKYGGNEEGMFVEQVYGKKVTGRFERAVMKCVATPLAQTAEATKVLQATKPAKKAMAAIASEPSDPAEPPLANAANDAVV